MALLEAVHHAQNVTSCRNKAHSLFAFAANTRDNAVVFLWKANAVNTLLPVDWAVTQMDVVYPWNATSRHIFFMRMDNQLANENFTELFMSQFAATWFVYKKRV
jgi:hypothetical protein